jgi:hypothetical protein
MNYDADDERRLFVHGTLVTPRIVDWKTLTEKHSQYSEIWKETKARRK